MTARRVKGRAKLLEAVPATEVRVGRGEVETTDVAVLDPRGKVTGIAKQYRVLDYLTRYRNLGVVSDLQWLAGRRFARDAETSIVGVPSQLDPARHHGGDGLRRMLREGSLASGASWRVRAAIQAMGDACGAVIWVAVHGRPIAEWSDPTISPEGKAGLFGLGLDRLVAHYGLDRVDGRGPM